MNINIFLLIILSIILIIIHKILIQDIEEFTIDTNQPELEEPELTFPPELEEPELTFPPEFEEQELKTPNFTVLPQLGQINSQITSLQTSAQLEIDKIKADTISANQNIDKLNIQLAEVKQKADQKALEYQARLTTQKEATLVAQNLAKQKEEDLNTAKNIADELAKQSALKLQAQISMKEAALQQTPEQKAKIDETTQIIIQKAQDTATTQLEEMLKQASYASTNAQIKVDAIKVQISNLNSSLSIAQQNANNLQAKLLNAKTQKVNDQQLQQIQTELTKSETLLNSIKQNIATSTKTADQLIIDLDLLTQKVNDLNNQAPLIIQQIITSTLSTLLPTQPLNKCHSDINGSVCNSTISSSYCNAHIENDGNFVVYNNNIPVWSSGTSGIGSPPYKLMMQINGNVKVLDSKGTPVWSSGIENKPDGPFQLVMQDDCNLVSYNSKQRSIWMSETTGTPSPTPTPTPTPTLSRAEIEAVRRQQYEADLRRRMQVFK